MEQIIKEIMVDVFEISMEEINEDSSMETVENWDSLKHISFLTEIEKRFNIRLDDNEMAEMTSLKMILDILGKKGI